MNDVSSKGSNDVNFKQWHEEEFFRSLTKSTITKLYYLYEYDFLLFGYNDTFNDYLDLGMSD